jgi:hypothetical protein
VDWAGLVREAFVLTRRGGALWRLGAVSAVQLALYMLLMAAAVLPIVALTQVLALSQAPGALSLGAAESMSKTLDWFSANRIGIWAGAMLLMIVWAASGVFDVAASAGSVSQTGRLAEGRSATFTQGMRDGFRVWWRIVGLLAIAAIPALASLAVLAMVTLTTITIPITQGQQPSPEAIGLGGTVNSLLSGVLGVLGIPLGVLAQLGMRFVVFEDAGWKSAWRSASQLARDRLLDVVIVYLVQAVVVWACSTAFAALAGAMVAVVAVCVAMLVGAAHSFSGAAFFVTAMGVLVLAAVCLAAFVFLLVWQSVMWTLFWRRVRGTGPGSGVHSGSTGVAGVAPQ